MQRYIFTSANTQAKLFPGHFFFGGGEGWQGKKLLQMCKIFGAQNKIVTGQEKKIKIKLTNNTHKVTLVTRQNSCPFLLARHFLELRGAYTVPVLPRGPPTHIKPLLLSFHKKSKNPRLGVIVHKRCYINAHYNT